jgi:hypothetical protein
MEITQTIARQRRFRIQFYCFSICFERFRRSTRAVESISVLAEQKRSCVWQPQAPL